MKQFELPTIEIIEINTDDVLTTSGPHEEGDLGGFEI